MQSGKPRLEKGSFAKVVGISFSNKDLNILDDIANEYGLSRSETVRHIVRAFSEHLKDIIPKFKIKK